MDLTKCFAEMLDDLGIAGQFNTFSEGFESWSVVSRLTDQDGDPLDLLGLMECAEIDSPESITIILNPSPWMQGEMIVSYQEVRLDTRIDDRDALRVFLFPLDRGGVLIVGMRVHYRRGLLHHFSDSYGWYVTTIESTKKDDREELRDYLVF